MMDMSDKQDQQAAERERIREHHRAALARVAGIPRETRDAELQIVREVAGARRRRMYQAGDDR
jgi:hypothetical protein